MLKETFDVVNADDEVVGVADRIEVHDNGLLHRAVHVLVYDPNGRLLVQRRGFNKDCSPGLWDSSAGGHVASGEPYEQAADRELTEELGIHSDTPLEFQFKIPASDETNNEFVSVYRGTTSQVPILQADELIAAQWLSIPELVAWMNREQASFTATFRKICSRCGYIET